MCSSSSNYFNQSGQTPSVPLSFHGDNRARLIKEMKENWGAKEGELLLFKGGEGFPRYDTDVEWVFRQESTFHYLFGAKDVGFFGVIDLTDGSAALFAPKLPAEYATWMGKIATREELRAHYEIDECLWVEEIQDYLKKKNPSKIYTLYGVNNDSGRETLEVTAEDIASLKEYTLERESLWEAVAECRLIKSEQELELLRYANRVSSAAHNEVMRRVRPGMTEYQLESLFLHYCYFYGGCRFTGYTCICASGCHASILHYGHAGQPNDKVIGEQDMLMLDMGGEYYCYTADISCSFPSSGRFSADQRALFEAVAAAQKAVMDAMRPGVMWPDMHRLAERTLLQHLKEIGILSADASVDDLMHHRIGAVFMPHGLGHLMGLDVHDIGGYARGAPERLKEPGLRSLRTARSLRAGMVLTVEPGCYFIDHLLDEALADPKKAHFFQLEVLARFRGTGGVRLEDDVVVTADGIENLTMCPRTVADVEAIMQEGRQKYGEHPELPGVVPIWKPKQK